MDNGFGSNLGTLLFACLWLGLWSTAVSFLSAGVVSGSSPFLAIFAISHGGAQVFVSWALTHGAASRGQGEPGAPSEIDLDHDSVSAEWNAGPRHWPAMIVYTLLGVFVHIALFSGTWGPVVAAGGVGLWGGFWLLLLTLAWTTTGFWWVRSFFQQVRAFDRVALDGTVDRLKVDVRGVGRNDSHTLDTTSLKVETRSNRLLLRDAEQMVELPCAETDERADLAKLLQQLAQSVEGASFEMPEEPEALRALRSTRPVSSG